MYKLKISPEAKNDLVEIKSYISQELCNPQVATNMVSKITEKIRGLLEHPGIGSPLRRDYIHILFGDLPENQEK